MCSRDLVWIDICLLVFELDVYRFLLRLHSFNGSDVVVPRRLRWAFEVICDLGHLQVVEQLEGPNRYLSRDDDRDPFVHCVCPYFPIIVMSGNHIAPTS
jgi:hypothetical protein